MSLHRLAVPAVLLAAVLPGCGQGKPSSQIAVPPDPRTAGDLTLTATARASAGEDVSLRLGRPRRCGATSPELTGARAAQGVVHLRGTTQVDRPGSYELCLVARGDGRARVLTRRALDVRAPHAEVHLRARGIGASYEPAEVRLSGRTELPAELALFIVGEDAPCRPGAAVPEGHPEATTAVAGRFALTMRAGLEDGPQLLCAVLRGGPESTDVLAAGQQRVLAEFGL